MKHLLLIIFLSLSFLGYSQSTHKIDSLKRVLAGLPVEGKSFSGDTLRVRVLCELAEQFNNPDSTIKYAWQAKTIAKERNWVDGEFESGFLLGKAFHRKNLYYQAVDTYWGLLTLTEKNHFKKREAVILRAIGDSYSYTSDFDLAKKSYEKSMQIFKSLKEYEEFADTQNNLAIVFNNNGQYPKAIELLNNCLTYLPYIKGKWSEISFYDNLGMAYNYWGKYDIALKYSLKCLNKIEKLGNGYDSWKAQAMVMIGFRYLRMNQNTKALYYANKAKDFLPKQTSDNIHLNELYYKIYKTINNDEKALYYLELFKTEEDKKIQVEQKQVLASLKSLYDLEKEKEKVLSLNTTLEKESLQKKVGFGAIVIITLFLILALWSYVNQKTKSTQIEIQKFAIQELNNSLENKVIERTQELSNANQELIQKNQEISEALFKGQSIERTRVASALHDNLGGSMAALKWMLESIDIENLSNDDKQIYQNAMGITSDTYSDVRFMSHNFIPEVLAQLGLQDAIKKLCQEISQTKRLQLDFEDNTISEFSHQIELEIYSICLELVTNIMKHSKATKAKILMTEGKTNLELIITDNGVGLSKDGIDGKGLKNIHKRLEAIKGKVEIISIANEATSFSLTIPLVMTAEYMNSQLNHINEG